MIHTSTTGKQVSQHELFRDFPQEVIELVVDQSEVRHLEAGEILLHPGTTNDSLFLVLDGELRVVLEKENTQISIPVKPGECLGEMSLIEERPTSATAVCQLASRVLVISADVFWSAIFVLSGIRE